MKLHQPGFRHEESCCGGFWAFGPLIGEESDKKVFPHILSHIRSAEGGNGAISAPGRKYTKEAALEWEDDPYEECGGFDTWFSPFIVILLFVLFLMLLVALC
jgi:hypothetical protein